MFMYTNLLKQECMLIIFIYNLFKRGDKCCSWLVFKLAKVRRALCRSRLRQRISFLVEKVAELTYKNYRHWPGGTSQNVLKLDRW